MLDPEDDIGGKQDWPLEHGNLIIIITIQSEEQNERSTTWCEVYEVKCSARRVEGREDDGKEGKKNTRGAAWYNAMG